MHFGGMLMKAYDKNPQAHLFWCLKQKRGIKVEKPNEALCEAYFKKAKSALNMLSAASQLSEVDWIASTAYYARYFAFYALLQTCGITSEIHDCTISLLRVLFVEEKLLPQETYTELKSAKELRVDTQYYLPDDTDLQKIKKEAETARTFVLKMEEIADKLHNDQITKLRQKLQP